MPYPQERYREDPGNYRPVSLTSVVCKLMEMVLKRETLNHLQHTVALSRVHYGFVPRGSCFTNLHNAEEEVTELMNARVGLVYLDFVKAFESVNHRMLCDKTHVYEIHQTIVDWTRSFFFNCIFKVSVAGFQSAPIPACSSVPPVSVLGSILFLLFVNDLPDIL